MIRIHREGRLIVAITVIFLVAVVTASALYLPYQFNYVSSGLSLAVLVLVLRFFRNPARKPYRDDKILTAPADGKVVAIERIRMEEYLDAPCTQVSIFMSIHDVHINYFPAGGKVEYLDYYPGKYLVARHPKSSSLNERYSVGIRTPYGPVLVRQIAGYVARRIRCYAREGEVARQGGEMGFIRFGSRLDLFIPHGFEIKVELNQRVTGGITPVARF